MEHLFKIENNDCINRCHKVNVDFKENFLEYSYFMSKNCFSNSTK